MHTLEGGGASGVARVLAEHLPETTSSTAKALYRVLVEVGVRVEQARGHSPNVAEAVLHLPLELVAEAAGISRMTAWRRLPELRALGLVDWRTHKANCRGETRNSGTVWRVRLAPQRGSRARVSADDLRHRWVRGMAGASSYRALLHTRTLKDRSLKVLGLLQWALSPASSNPVTPVCNTRPRMSLEMLLNLTGTPRGERAQAVDQGAQVLAQALRDASSVNWYRRLLWQLLRRYDATGRDDSRVVYLVAQRAGVDAQEWGGLRRPGALFQTRLRGRGWLQEVMSAPPLRVA